MSYVLDLGIVLIFALMVFIGYKRGMFKALTRLLGIGLVLLLAVVLSQPAAEWAFDSFAAEKITASVAENLEDESDEAMRSGISSVLEKLPSPIVNMMANNDLGTVDQIADKLEEEQEKTTLSAAEVMTNTMIRPIGISLFRIVFFFLMMTFGMIVVLIILKLINKVITRLPIVKGVNKWLGLLFGAVEGVVVVLVLVAVLQTAANAGNADSWVTQEDLDHTIFTGAIAEVNPLNDMFTF